MFRYGTSATRHIKSVDVRHAMTDKVFDISNAIVLSSYTHNLTGDPNYAAMYI
jgi:hypothetical protein